MIPPDVLLSWYREGLFPMADDDGTIRLYCPDPRGIIDLDAFSVPRSLSRVIRSGRFDVTWNHSFKEVIRACADREETWISAEIIDSYRELHRLGHAHSLEVWQDDTLAGGLYGVAIGGAFFGESMFHVVTDASKVALVELVERMRQRGMALLDIQWLTPHLARFAGKKIPRAEYVTLLGEALALNVSLFDAN